jgi:hypothetical protein
MFNWFRRRGEPRPQTREKARSAAPAATPAGLPADFADTAPLPRVVAEGNSEADWSMWEDSMITLDSQLQGLSPVDRAHMRDPRPSQLDDIDAFASVRRRRDR